MRIDFYYWGMQCPIIDEMLDLLNEYNNKFDICLYDVTDNYLIAEKQQMFFPFLTVIEGRIRYRGPINRSVLDKLPYEHAIVESPYIIPLASNIYEGEIIPLTNENISLASSGCTLTQCKEACNKKGAFLAENCEDVFGFINKKGNRILGGAEYIPSIKVPYKIPKDRDIAFLTCLYHSSTEYDYKSAPLNALEKYLKTKCYHKIIAITDEESTFPNGNLNWFLSHGYKDENIISIEKDYCVLHLVSKEL
jgi:hypothetical protein